MDAFLNYTIHVTGKNVLEVLKFMHNCQTSICANSTHKKCRKHMNLQKIIGPPRLHITP